MYIFREKKKKKSGENGYYEKHDYEKMVNNQVQNNSSMLGGD